jgi:hypothetical protein
MLIDSILRYESGHKFKSPEQGFYLIICWFVRANIVFIDASKIKVKDYDE